MKSPVGRPVVRHGRVAESRDVAELGLVDRVQRGLAPHEQDHDGECEPVASHVRPMLFVLAGRLRPDQDGPEEIRIDQVNLPSALWHISIDDDLVPAAQHVGQDLPGEPRLREPLRRAIASWRAPSSVKCDNSSAGSSDRKRSQ